MPSALSVRSLLRRLTMPITVAPRSRARSTVRLVSVVVPLWLTATTSGVAQVQRHADSRRTRWRSSASTPEARHRAARPARIAAMLWPATAAVPWPITRTRLTVPDASRSATTSGRARSPSSGAEQAVALSDAAAQRLAEAGRGLGDLLEQEVRVAAPVDVAGRDLGDLLVVGAEGQLGAVVGQSPDAVAARPPAARRARRPAHGCRAGRPAAGSRRRCARSGTSPRRGRRARTPR